MLNDNTVWVRGAGELGSGIAHLLHRVGFSVFLSEISPPLAIRRPVSFSDAIFEGEKIVEGVVARLGKNSQLPTSRPWTEIPLFEDESEKLLQLKPDVIVDARMLKRYDLDYRSWAKLFIGLGPGFNTSENCHRAIETMRGHDLGRVILQGEPLADTGVPGKLGGETSRRLMRASEAGHVEWLVNFGAMVHEGQTLGTLNGTIPLLAPLDGMIRGMISPLTPVSKNMKIGDVDPRGAGVKYLQLSEKVRAIAAGVFEAIVLYFKDQRL